MKRNCLIILFIICIAMNITKYGVTIVVGIILAAMLAGIAAIAPFWLFCFMVVSLSVGVRKAWVDLNPVTIFKECYCSKTQNNM